MYDPFDSLVGRQPQSPSTGLSHNLEGARAANPSQGGSQPSAWQGAQPQPRYQYHQNQPQLQPRLHTQQHNFVGGGVDGQGYPQHGVRSYSAQQQQQQQQQPGFVSSVGYTPRTQPGQHVTPAMAPWGGLASVPGAMANVPSPSAGVGYASQHLQQQQQPQQQRQQQDHLPPHSVIQQQGRTGHLVWDKPTQSVKVFLPNAAQTLTTTNIVGLATAAPVTPQSTPHLSSPLRGADARTDGGAEWLPPGEQLASYESMFTSASAGSAVPGTVSGRAAVQFFSRSGLPKDVLKTIWSLCDPTLTGSIRRPGFFAAMRLISIAQGHHPGTVASSVAKDPPHLRAALERTRHAPLPPPRMGNLNSSLPAPEAVGASSGGGGKTHPVAVSAPSGLAPASLGAPSFPGGAASSVTAAPTAAAAAAAWTNDVTTAWIAAAGAPSGVNDRSVGGVHAGATGVSPRVGAAAPPPAPAGSAGGGDRGSVPSPFDGLLSVAKPSGAAFGSVSGGEGDGIAVNPAEQALDGKTLAAEREKEQGGGGDDDEDFGDFEGAEDPSLAEPPPLPLAPLVAAAETVNNDEDFGDFSGAPDGEGAFAAEVNSNSTTGVAYSAVTVTAASPVASASVRDGGRSEEAGVALDAGETWTMGSGGEWPTETMGKGVQGGLDEMMRSNLDEAAAGAVHLADMQSTPSLLGKPHDPVMVERADAGSSNKLSVFDAMADLDLAIGQEEWNDFADETTAPPRSPTPPPSTPSEVVVEESVEVAVAAAAAVNATAVDVSGVKAEEVPVFSMGRGVEGFPSVTPTDAEDVGESDDWGAFEDAGEALAAVAAALVVEKVIAAPVMISSEAEESEEEWGEFEEVPAGEEVGAGAGDDGSAGHEPVCVKAGGDDFAPGTAVWGNVDEDAEEALAAVAAAIVVEKVVVAPAKISLEAEGSEDWGGFEEVPVAEAGEEVGAGHDGSVGQEPLYAKTGGDDLAPATAVEDPTGETRAGSTEAAEPDDPFADIAPRTPLPPARPLGSPMPPLELEDRTLSGEGVVERGDAPEGQKEGRQDGESGDFEKGSLGSVKPEQPGASSIVGTKKAEAVEEFQRVMAAGLPLPLRAMRDALSARGRLEEAAEVERRMELPALSTREVGVEGDETATEAEEGAGAGVPTASRDDITGTKGKNVGGCGSGGDGEDLRVDLERWRAVAEEPPSPTIEELAGRVATADAGRGERFLERFVRGRPPVEEEALAHGGAVALGAALERQRAARRAAYVSRVLGSLSAITRNEDNAAEKEPEVELDLGLHSSHARATASLSDWARMTAFVARALEAGLAAISNSEGLENTGRCGGEGSEGDSATVHSLAPPPPSNHHHQQEQQGVNARVSTEVARSAKFEAFCRGLGEAVAVCRMLQASAVDSLTGVEGFEDLERSWGEFQRRARDTRRGGGGASGCSNDRESSGKVIPVEPGLGVENDGGEEEEWLTGGTGDKDGVCGSVAGIRGAVGRRAPAGSALCAVCLQPLEVFAGASLGLSVVKYCGVRYFASAINLWVNALDKAPPSEPLSQQVFEEGEPTASTTL